MSQWHQFQVTKRNNISYQIYSTKDDRLEKLTYSFFGFSIVNWIAENEQLYRCCYTDVVGSPSPFGLPCGRGEGTRRILVLSRWNLPDSPKLPFLIYPPFPIKACNPPPPKSSTSYTPPDRVITTIVTKYAQGKALSLFKAGIYSRIRKHLGNYAKTIIRLRLREDFFNNFLDLVWGIIEQYSLSLQRIIVSYKENNFSANSFN